ncbi:polyprenol phosphomannose-dependent alpha 1,6 mannosyltransferase MptB [Dietzia sp. PP-33]|jgi:alpha-1,6-mannosyltransferase|uniref:polyprenol phosphomannose-dependent alpha 1,6 mannosyltransferase MptB n=1 Tax=Dietzia sp. PP-33 TaxID=2957500 RepID=UPI0029A26F18|nr:polyprenol phosphomannose-dependent alpha 1,6 mannosyltransferase MptB [Dietzia sp. PP-33]MDX2357387.1 polyprenol phosphomannose-dependent alpha 1,6 mannosyltransferase MptB [Dietzia sp. PP-33]
MTAPDPVPETAASTSLATSARSALTGPSGPALRRGVLGSVLLTLGGFGAGALPVDGGPAAAVGLLGFTFGHGAILALALCWIGVVLMVTAWLALGPRAFSGRLPTRDAVWATALWALPLLPAVPMFSRDAWSYLAQGAMTAAGVDPYEFGPEANPGPFTDEVSPDWRSTATPYGPLHLLLMRIVVGMSGGHPAVGIIILRLLVLAALAALTALLVMAARRTGVDAGAAVWLACASPLAVIHLAGGLHNEVFPLVACVGAVVLALDGRPSWAGAAIGIAVAFKATAVIVAPFLLWIALSRRRADPAEARPGLRALTDTALAAAVAAVVLALATLASGTGIGWLDAIAVSDRVINYLSAPTAVAHLVHAVADSPGFEDVLAVSRQVGRVVLAVTLVAVWWLHRRDRITAIRGIMWALLAFVVLNSLAWPWYHVWVAAFWVLARPGRRSTSIAVALTVFLVMAIGPNGSTSLYSPVLVGIAVIGSLLAGWWWWRATDGVRTPSPARDG